MTDTDATRDAVLREKAGDGTTDFFVEVRQSDLSALLRERDGLLRQRWGHQNRAEVAERGHQACLARESDRAALASRGEPAAHAADCDCLACDPDPVLDSPLAVPAACLCRDLWGNRWDNAMSSGGGTQVIAPECPVHGNRPLAAPGDWATVEAARRAIKDALWESPTPTGLEGIPHAQSDTIIAWFAAREARLRAADQAKAEALYLITAWARNGLIEIAEGIPNAKTFWLESIEKKARAALAAAAAAPKEPR